jgi:hypothetical protein
MKSITVVIAGQIRNQHVLMRSVENLAPLRSLGLVDRIILATWTEDVAKITSLLPRLAEVGVTVVSADEPDAQWFVPGHMMNQMRGLDLAMETVEDTAWVLRTRPDVLIDADTIAALARADLTLAPADVGAGSLSHKIWAPFVELTQPMCLSDITFFGQYADIMKLQNFDFFHEVARTHMFYLDNGKPLTSYDAEVRRYAPAFFGSHPIIAEYYRTYNRFYIGIHELRRAVLGTIFNEPFYWQYMAAYFDIINRYVLVGHDVVQSSVLLIRPKDFDQATDLIGVDLIRCQYAEQVLAQAPDAALTVQLFADAPIYCHSSAEVRKIHDLLVRIGIPMEKHLKDALAYRKDAARIAELQAFRDRLARTINSGVEWGRTKVLAWQQPFARRTIDLR